MLARAASQPPVRPRRRRLLHESFARYFGREDVGNPVILELSGVADADQSSADEQQGQVVTSE